MRILLDTHTFIWFSIGATQLSDIARGLIEDPANQKLLSAVVGWEMAILLRLDRIQLHQHISLLLDQAIAPADWTWLAISNPALSQLSELPRYKTHVDPFDSMFAAQAITEQVPFVSKDTKVDQFGVERVW